MPAFDLEWTSTPEERYDDSPNSMTNRAHEAVGLAYVGGFGGSDGSTADNGISIRASLEDARALASKVAQAIGKTVGLVDPDDGTVLFVASKGD